MNNRDWGNKRNNVGNEMRKQERGCKDRKKEKIIGEVENDERLQDDMGRRQMRVQATY